MKENELLDSFNDPDKFRLLFQDYLDFSDALKEFPHHGEKLVSTLIQNPAEFQRIFSQTTFLQQTGKNFPQHAEEIINVVLRDKNEFKRLIISSNALIYTAKVFPKQARSLVNVILQDKNEFQRIITNAESFDKIIESFPQDAKGIADSLLEDKGHLKNLLTSSPNSLPNLTKRLPKDYAGQVVEFFLKNQCLSISHMYKEGDSSNPTNWTTILSLSYSKVKEIAHLLILIHKRAEHNKEPQNTSLTKFGLFPKELILKIACLAGTDAPETYQKVSEKISKESNLTIS